MGGVSASLNEFDIGTNRTSRETAAEESKPDIREMFHQLPRNREIVRKPFGEMRGQLIGQSVRRSSAIASAAVAVTGFVAARWMSPQSRECRVVSMKERGLSPISLADTTSAHRVAV